MKIVITGVNGYIGSRLALELLRQGHAVLGIDMASSHIGQLDEFSDFEFVQCNITDTSEINRSFSGAILIHCAALVHNKAADLSEQNYFKVNVQGTKNILDLLDATNIKHIIYFSTVSVYGNRQSEGITTEETVCLPEDSYGKSKLMAEEVIKKYANDTQAVYTILRLTPVYGKDFLINLKKRVYLLTDKLFYKIGSGRQQLSLVSVLNVTDIVLAIIKNSQPYENNTVILKDAKDYALNEVIAIFKKSFHQEAFPVIRIPYGFVRICIFFLGLIFPEKAKFLLYQINKVSNDSVYSGAKIMTLMKQLNWDLQKTLLN